MIVGLSPFTEKRATRPQLSEWPALNRSLISDKSAQTKGILSIARPFGEVITLLDDCEGLHLPSRAESPISRSF
jgi:hypothetical protein